MLSGEEILQFREAVAQVPAAPNVVDYAVRLARASRPGDDLAPDYIEQYVHWGASPRAAQHLILAGRARAACEGRFNVAREDIEAVALPVLRHRLIRTFRAESKGQTTDDIISELLQFSRSTHSETEDGNVNTVLEEAIRAMTEPAERNGVTIAAGFADDDMPPVRGSKLFQKITELPEYYLTNCELDILRRHKGTFSQLMDGVPFNLIDRSHCIFDDQFSAVL